MPSYGDIENKVKLCFIVYLSDTYSSQVAVPLHNYNNASPLANYQEVFRNLKE